MVRGFVTGAAAKFSWERVAWGLALGFVGFLLLCGCGGIIFVALSHEDWQWHEPDGGGFKVELPNEPTDLKAFARCGVHGTTAITAITAQNTVAVTAVESVSPAMIEEQVRAVAADIHIDAVKIGMLADAVVRRLV